MTEHNYSSYGIYLNNLLQPSTSIFLLVVHPSQSLLNPLGKSMLKLNSEVAYGRSINDGLVTLELEERERVAIERRSHNPRYRPRVEVKSMVDCDLECIVKASVSSNSSGYGILIL